MALGARQGQGLQEGLQTREAQPARRQGWRAQLDLHAYRVAGAAPGAASAVGSGCAGCDTRSEGSSQLATTRVDATHSGPLRVLKALYPEGPAVCHHTLVHPPAGVVGGDSLALNLRLQAQAHLVLTTPGATRFYRGDGLDAEQHVQATLAPGARLEWLPQEALVYNGAQAFSRQCFALAPGAQMLGWDLVVLGLPAAAAPFASGFFQQHLEIQGLWLERGRVQAVDGLLRQSPLGLAGFSVMGTMWWAAGDSQAEFTAGGHEALAQQALASCREVLEGQGLCAAATALAHRAVVVRVLAHHSEQAMQLFRRIRLQWRRQLWQLPGTEPRIWAT